jgi:DNA mismatch endonuclease (patch repair protein)
MKMTDTFSKEKRHEVMSKIRGKDTKIEIKVRHWLYHHGIRYRKNCKDIAGKPDIAIKKYKIAIFIHGCFWHGHENCKYYRLPKSNTEFWKDKLKRIKERSS